MTVTNNQSKSIDITSENINAVIANPDEYLQIDITLKMNCCPQEYYDTIIPSSEAKWYVNILKPSGNRYALPLAIYFKNFDNGEVFKIDLNEYPIPILNCSDLAEITTIIDNYINANFSAIDDSDVGDSDSDIGDSDSDSDSFVQGQVIGGCDSTSKEDSFIYSLSGLPENTVPLYLDYEYDDVPLIEGFYSAYSQKNSILTSEGISLSPQIIDDVKFPDAVYIIVVTIIKNSGTQIKETQCFFLDCYTKCKTIELAAVLPDAERTELLMLHYGLSVGSNCACSCSELCLLYRKLAKWLNYKEENCDCDN